MVCVMNGSERPALGVRRRCLIATIGLWSTSVALSAPTITSTTGTPTSRSAITLTGSGFGASGPTTRQIWDDFETGTVGNNIAASPREGTWAYAGSTPSKYASDFAHSGTISSKATMTSAHQFSGFDSADGVLLNQTYVYQSFWFRYVDNRVALDERKVMQIHGNHTGCNYTPGVDNGDFPGWSTDTHPDPNNCNSPPAVNDDWPSSPASGQWHFWEFIGKQSTPNVADGTVIARVDGVTVANHAGNIVTRVSSADWWNLVTFFGGITNSDGYPSYVWVDDAYLVANTTNAWARVVLGNAATYPTSTKFDTQRVSSWSSTSITVLFNQGAYQPGQTSYLYVCDLANTCNSNGFPITIGGSSSSLPAPLNLTRTDTH